MIVTPGTGRPGVVPMTTTGEVELPLVMAVTTRTDEGVEGGGAVGGAPSRTERAVEDRRSHQVTVNCVEVSALITPHWKVLRS